MASINFDDNIGKGQTKQISNPEHETNSSLQATTSVSHEHRIIVDCQDQLDFFKTTFDLIHMNNMGNCDQQNAASDDSWGLWNHGKNTMHQRVGNVIQYHTTLENITILALIGLMHEID